MPISPLLIEYATSKIALKTPYNSYHKPRRYETTRSSMGKKEMISFPEPDFLPRAAPLRTSPATFVP